jgi:hypothetical protein
MLVPLDGSELAEIVLLYAKEVAGRLDLEQLLVSISTGSLVPEAEGRVLVCH